MNDRERELWVLNDEGLYRWYKSERVGLYQFINNNRAEITRLIKKVV